jgi:hypothetical protein
VIRRNALQPILPFHGQRQSRTQRPKFYRLRSAAAVDKSISTTISPCRPFCVNLRKDRSRSQQSPTQRDYQKITTLSGLLSVRRVVVALSEFSRPTFSPRPKEREALRWRKKHNGGYYMFTALGLESREQKLPFRNGQWKRTSIGTVFCNEASNRVSDMTIDQLGCPAFEQLPQVSTRSRRLCTTGAPPNDSLSVLRVGGVF